MCVPKLAVLGEHITYHRARQYAELFSKAAKSRLEMLVLGVKQSTRASELMAAAG